VSQLRFHVRKVSSTEKMEDQEENIHVSEEQFSDENVPLEENGFWSVGIARDSQKLDVAVEEGLKTRGDFS